MRLIDADKLWLKTGEVDAAPTVEAIPIEWIEMFIQKYKFYGEEEYKLFHFMLTKWKKWEKENEL